MTNVDPVSRSRYFDGWTRDEIARFKRGQARVVVTGRIMNGKEVDPELLAVADFAEGELPVRPGPVRRWFAYRFSSRV